MTTFLWLLALLIPIALLAWAAKHINNDTLAEKLEIEDNLRRSVLRGGIKQSWWKRLSKGEKILFVVVIIIFIRPVIFLISSYIGVMLEIFLEINNSTAANSIVAIIGILLLFQKALLSSIMEKARETFLGKLSFSILAGIWIVCIVNCVIYMIDYISFNFLP